MARGSLTVVGISLALWQNPLPVVAAQKWAAAFAESYRAATEGSGRQDPGFPKTVKHRRPALAGYRFRSRRVRLLAHDAVEGICRFTETEAV